MRIIFMGTPDFARKSLQRLYDDGHDIAAVFAGDDKPRGRGMKLTPCPVKELAITKGTNVFHAADLTVANISAFKPDLIAVVAYGKILPVDILEIPPQGSINIHGSLLPKYRGAAPIQYALLNGEIETGVTSQYMAKEMDAGDIILTRVTQIGEDETSADLFERLGDIGADLLSETVNAIEQGSAPRIPQNHDDATYTSMLTRDMAPIDWSKSAFEIKCKVRALIPWPVATMCFQDKVLKVYAVETTTQQKGERAGTVLTANPRGIEVACADGTVIITRLQAPGGKVMDAADYLRGLR